MTSRTWVASVTGHTSFGKRLVGGWITAGESTDSTDRMFPYRAASERSGHRVEHCRRQARGAAAGLGDHVAGQPATIGKDEDVRGPAPVEDTLDAAQRAGGTRDAAGTGRLARRVERRGPRA